MILGLLYVSFAVENADHTRRAFKELFGLPAERIEPDPFLGTGHGARIAFPNDCWLYAMESQQPESPTSRFLEEHGPGLERVAFLSDDIEGDFERVRQGGVPLSDDMLVDTSVGRRFVVPPEYMQGTKVELLQPSEGSWIFNAPDSISGVLGLQHIGVAARDLEATKRSFKQLFDIQPRDLRHDQHGGQQKDVIFTPGNDRLWLHVVESWEPNSRVVHYLQEKGEGLEHICIEVDDIRQAVKRVLDAGVPLMNHKIHTDRPDGFEAFVHADHTTGLTVELIEPFPSSRGYRPCKWTR